MSADVIDFSSIITQYRARVLEDQLAEAKATIAYMAGVCRQARKDCMHAKSVQAQLLDAAIERAERKR